MSNKEKLKKLMAARKPKAKLKFVMNEKDITDEPNIVWVLFQI